MSFESILATSPFDSTIPLEILILILLFCNFICFLYHYFSLIYLNNKLKTLDIEKDVAIQNNENSKNTLRHNFSRGFFDEITEILHSISKIKLTDKIQLDFHQNQIENKIKHQISKRSKTFYFPIIAFLIFIIDVLLKLNIMNGMFYQSKHQISLFDFYYSLMGPIIIIFSFCFINVLFSIWIFISARINFEKIKIKLDESIKNYLETKKLSGKVNSSSVL